MMEAREPDFSCAARGGSGISDVSISLEPDFQRHILACHGVAPDMAAELPCGRGDDTVHLPSGPRKV